MIAPHSTTAFVFSVAALSAASACSLWTSRVHQFFFFGRTLPPEFSVTPTARRITREYRAWIAAGFVGALVLFFALELPAVLNLQVSFFVAILLQASVFHLAFAHAHRQAGDAATPTDLAWASAPAQRSVSVPLLESALPAMPPIYAALLPLAATAASWLIAMVAGRQSLTAVANAMDSGQASFLSGLGFGLLFSSTAMFFLLRFTARNRTPMARYTIRTSILLGWVGALAVSLTVLRRRFTWSLPTASAARS